MSQGPADDRPVLRIVSGNPSDEELAAVTAVLTALARATGDAPAAAAPVGGWSDPARRLRRPLRPGPGAWRASAW